MRQKLAGSANRSPATPSGQNRAAHESNTRMYTTSDSSVEFILDEVAKAVRSRRRSPGVNMRRVSSRNAEAFNRVSYASARRLDKIGC